MRRGNIVTGAKDDEAAAAYRYHSFSALASSPLQFTRRSRSSASSSVERGRLSAVPPVGLAHSFHDLTIHRPVAIVERKFLTVSCER